MKFKSHTFEEAKREYLKHKKNKRLYGALLFICVSSAVASFVQGDRLIGFISVLLSGLLGFVTFKTFILETHYRTVIR